MRQLVNAYLNTCYRVRLPDAWTALRIGYPPTGRDILTTAEWLIITACNPYSRQLPNTHNLVRHCLLSRRLRAHGLTAAYPTVALADEAQPSWPNEYGWLVLSNRWPLLFELARKFAQHAVVTCNAGHPPKLCIMRGRHSVARGIVSPHVEFAD